MTGPQLVTSCKVQPGADARLHVRLRQSTRDLVGCLPARAVPGHQPPRGDRGQFVQRARDYRLEDTPGEVHTAYEGVHAILAGQPLGLAQHVDRSGVAAPRKHYEALALEIHNYRLVVPDPGIRLPAAVRARVIEREALLKVGNALDLAGYQHRAIDQEARLALLGDLDPLAVEILAARWWEVQLGARREDYLAVSPGLRVDNERHPPGTDAPDHTLQPAVVIAVPVRHHDRP